MTQVAVPPVLLRKNQRLGHDYICLQREGTTSNGDAIGSRVTVELD